MKKLLSLCIMTVLAIAVVTLSPVFAYAEVHQITAEGTWEMGDGDSKEVAKEKAIQDAMKVAVKKAGTYVESYAKMQNHKLTANEVETVAAGIVKVDATSVSYDTYNKYAWICHAVINAEVDDSNIDFNAIMQNHRQPSYQQTQERIDYGGVDYSKATEIVIDARAYHNYIADGIYMPNFKSGQCGSIEFDSSCVRGKNGIVAASPSYYYRKGEWNNKPDYEYGSCHFIDDIYDAPKEARKYTIPLLFIEKSFEDDLPDGKSTITRYNNFIIDSEIANALPRLTPRHVYVLF